MNKIRKSPLLLGILISISLGPAIRPPMDVVKVNHKEVACLAKNIYHEARGEPLNGQLAVAQVTVNRLKSGDFGSSICEVVYQPNQFSWTLERAKKIVDLKAWQDSVILATAVLANKAHLPDFKALYFHTKKVKPKWRKTKQVVTTIGNHIFYM